MKIVDLHAHFYPAFMAEDPEVWAKSVGENYWGFLMGKREDGKTPLQGFPSEEKFLGDMAKAGVSRSVLQGWYWENSATCKLANVYAEKFCLANPDKISAFAAVNPADEGEALEIVKSARSQGFAGVGEIHDGVQKFDFLSGAFGKFARACGEEGLPICVHLTEESQRNYRGKVPTNNAAAFEAARKFPETKFIFAHWAGSQSFFDLKPPPNVLLDSAATPLLFRVDTSAWKIIPAILPDSCAFGTDYPIRLYPKKFKQEELQTIVSEAIANVPKECAEKFFHGNAERFLAL